MKWLFFVLSVLFKPISELAVETVDPFEKVKSFLVENALRVFMGLFALLVVGMLFSSGIILTVINLTSQYDQGMAPRFTGSVAGSLGLVLGSSLILAIALYFISASTSSEEKKRRRVKERLEHQTFQSQTLEQALVLLINDFIKERETKRSEARNEESPPKEHGRATSEFGGSGEHERH